MNPRKEMRFDQSPEGQKTASLIMSAVHEGEEARRSGKPLYDKDGTLVYRVLLFGFRWVSAGKGLCSYRAQDGSRQWAIGKNTNNRWDVVLHGDEGSPRIIASDLQKLSDAKSTAEHHARRMPWVEGAPW